MKAEMLLDCWNMTTHDVDNFSVQVKELEDNGIWLAGITSKALKVDSMDGPIVVDEGVKKTGAPRDAVYDTAERTKLLLQVGSTTHCIRDSAMPSLFSTAKINGSALGRMCPYSLSQVLNYCFAVTKGESLILTRAGKVSAVMSDNAGGYKTMSQTGLVNVAIDKMADQFGKVDFKEGYVAHDLTSFLVEFPDMQQQMSDTYNTFLPNGARKLELMPAARFYTSDTGASAATLMPLYRPINQKYYYSVNNGLKVNHTRVAQGHDGIDRFAVVAAGLFAKFADTEETIKQMMQVVIEHPVNAYVLLVKKAGIPLKYAAAGYTDIQNFCQGMPCTMHDIYLSITLCLSEAMAVHTNRRNMMALDEAVAQVLKMNWKDYDVPGTVAWNMPMAA